MIWYDVETKEPYAPGACEDGGLPSIEKFTCPKCNKTDEVAYSQAFGACINCGNIVLMRA